MITPQLKEAILAVAEFSAEEMEFIGQCFISRLPDIYPFLEKKMGF